MLVDAAKASSTSEPAGVAPTGPADEPASVVPAPPAKSSGKAKSKAAVPASPPAAAAPASPPAAAPAAEGTGATALAVAVKAKAGDSGKRPASCMEPPPEPAAKRGKVEQDQDEAAADDEALFLGSPLSDPLGEEDGDDEEDSCGPDAKQVEAAERAAAALRTDRDEKRLWQMR